MEKCPYCINSLADAIGPSGCDYFMCRTCSRTFDLNDLPKRCTGKDVSNDPCRGWEYRDGLCLGCFELNALCKQHDAWYDEHGGEA